MLHKVSNSRTGNGTFYVGTNLRGRIHAVKVEADSDATDEWDLTMTGNETEVPIMAETTIDNNATSWFYPRVMAIANEAGSAFMGADIYAYDESLKCVVAGTAAGVITVTVFYEPM
jgi:RecB family endonuclease NucS